MTTRRSFFHAIGAALSLAVLPAASAQYISTPVAIKTVGTFQFFGPLLWDYDRELCMGLKLPDGRQIGTRFLLTHPWRKMGPEAREEITRVMKKDLLKWAERQYARPA